MAVNTERQQEQERVLDGGLLVFDTGNEPMMDAFGRVRADFVAHMGWRRGADDDRDEYDVLEAGSIYMTKFDEQRGNIISGMRLTPADGYDTTLSYQMVAQSDAIREACREHPDTPELVRAAGRGDLWDLTRLVHTYEHQYRADVLVDGMVEVIAAGIAATASEGREPVWLFATTPKMLRIFEAVGVVYTVLGVDKVNGDTSKTYFGFARPLECLAHVQADPERYGRTVESVERAFRLLGQSSEA